MYHTSIDIADMAQKYFMEGYNQHRKGDYDRAQELYLKSIKSYPTAHAYTFLGWSMSMQGRYSEAIEQCEKAIQINPDYGNPYNDIGSYYLELGRLDDAEPFLIRATQITHYQNKHFAYYNLGRLYEMKGMFYKAYMNYKRSCELDRTYKQALHKVKKMLAMLN